MMNDLNDLTLAELLEELVTPSVLDRLLDAAIEEDLGAAGDITTASLIDPDLTGRATLLARDPGVVAGLPLIPRVLKRFDGDIAFTARSADGKRCSDGEVLGEFNAPLAGILTAERTILNLLGKLSGVATMTRRFVDLIAETGAVICETRKTTPGLRALEKYAVRCGGGTLHRVGLFDAALYKDNHLAHIPADELANRVEEAARWVRREHEVRFVEVEVDSLDQLEQIIGLERGLIDLVLLDNMPEDQMREAVALRNERGSSIELEASGRITLDRVRLVAETGVDRISVGAITHSAPVLDVAMEIE